jgi:PAS domain-containing protein
MEVVFPQHREVLEASEARFRTIIEKSADGILIVGGDGLIRFANPAAEALMGRPRAELTDAPFGIPLVPGEATEVDILRNGDGDAYVAEMRVVETEWEGETVYLASLRDISARRRAEEALRESEARLRLALQAADLGTWEYDPASGEMKWSDRAQRILQVSLVGAWLLCGMVFVLLWAEHLLSVQHPMVAPLAALLGLLLAAVVVCLVSGLWLALHRRLRGRTAGACMGALVPVGLVLFPLHYARSWLAEGVAPRNPVMITAGVFIATLMEAAAGSYPHRVRTPRLVMYYRHTGDPRQEAEAMDAFIGQLERKLGRDIRERVHWVRGPLLGRSRFSLYGLAAGTDAGPPTVVDRHEFAHAVLAQMVSPHIDPPTLLLEGWAEAQASPAADLRTSVLALRREGRTLSLRELLSSYWYHRHDGVIYPQGAAFVDFLIRTYGVERFLSLYHRCRPDDPALAFRQVLGVELDALEKQFWTDMEAEGSSQ